MEEKYVYPVILNYENDSSGYDYFVTIPDFDGYTQGKNIADAIDMARDYIGNHWCCKTNVMFNSSLLSIFHQFIDE